MSAARRVLVTGAAGYIGRQVAEQLVRDGHQVIGTDVRPVPDAPFEARVLDIRDPALAALCRDERVEAVVHLAAVLEGGRDRARDFDIDVNGTRNVLAACEAAGVRHLTVSSSGAAYGYHADSPRWITEDAPLRGNAAFAYADHKRQVEALLADWAPAHPATGVLVLRICTVLGPTTRNQITALFDRPRLLHVAGGDDRFVFVADDDLVACIAQGVSTQVTGAFNVAGDGALTVHELAAMLGKPVRTLPAWLLQAALGVGRALGLSRYGPEQVDFLRYRPVLSNAKLKAQFPFTPTRSSRQAFERYVQARRPQ